MANQDTSSSVSNRIINGVSAAISLVAGRGRVLLEYDGASARWRVINHEQGGPITPSFNSGDVTANGSMTWTVDSGDVAAYSYVLQGSELSVSLHIAGTTVGGTLSNTLQIAVPGGFAPAEDCRVAAFINDNGTQQAGRAEVVTSGTVIKVLKIAGGNLAASTNATAVACQLVIRVS